MTSYETQRQDLLTLFRAAIDIAHTRGAVESEQQLAVAMRRLQDGRLATVVCGEYKRGKSTLLGALLEDPGLFPVDVDITTNMVTMVSYRAAELINVILIGDGEEEAREISRADIPMYVTEQQNRGNAKNVRLLTIETPSQKLATGLTFVDTPGVGGLNHEHTAVTYGFLPAADAVIFVGDATTPLGESELEFVRQISEYCSVILYVITKIDLRDDYAKIVGNTRVKLAEVTGKPADDLVVIPVSSAAKLAYLETGDGEDLELSNFPALERSLRDVLERRRGQILITRAVLNLARASDAVAQPMRTELTATKDTAGTELASITADLEDKKRRMAELSQGRAIWRQDLGTYMDKVHSDIRNQLNGSISRIWQRIPSTYLEDDRMLAQPTLIIGALEADIGLLLGSLAQQATEQAATVQDRLERETGLALTRQQVGPIALPPVEVEITGYSPQAETSQDRRLRQLRDAKFSGGLGVTIGGIIGGLLGGPAAPLTATIGAAIGGIVAGGYGVFNARKSISLRDRTARISAIRSELVPVQSLHRTEADRAISEAIRQLTGAVERELDAKIRLEYESVTVSHRSLQEAKSRTASDSAQRIRELSGELQRLDRGLEYCETVLKALAAAPDTTASPQPVTSATTASELVFEDPGLQARNAAS